MYSTTQDKNAYTITQSHDSFFMTYYHHGREQGSLDLYVEFMHCLKDFYVKRIISNKF